MIPVNSSTKLKWYKQITINVSLNALYYFFKLCTLYGTLLIDMILVLVYSFLIFWQVRIWHVDIPMSGAWTVNIWISSKFCKFSATNDSNLSTELLFANKVILNGLNNMIREPLFLTSATVRTIFFWVFNTLFLSVEFPYKIAPYDIKAWKWVM